MKNEIEVNDELIARYLGGEASPEEAMALDSWLQLPENRANFDALQRVWSNCHPAKALREVNIEQAWSALSRKKDLPLQARSEDHVGSSSFRMAAAISLLACVAGILYYSFRKENKIERVAESRDSLLQVTFSDNSKAMLNIGCTLEYPESFHDGREVSLKNGEAFFSIEADPEKPFIIRTSVATIRVLGTAFNVLIHNETVELSVEHGSVSLYTKSDSAVVESGEAARVATGENSITLRKANSNDWAYATHKFIFEDTPIHEVFKYIEKAQNCTISLSDPDIGNCKLSATFESVSTDYMLTLITEALNLSVIKNDSRTFTVVGEGCR